MARALSWWPACSTSLPRSTHTICGRGGKGSHAALPLYSGRAVCPLCVGGLRHHTARNAPAHASLWSLLLCAVCGLGDRAELADVLYRALGALPDRGVERVHRVVAIDAVKVDCVGVGLGHRQRDLACSGAYEAGCGHREQHSRQALAAIA